jgi:hypothetical protein
MRIFVFSATYELRVSRKNHLRDHWPPYQNLRLVSLVSLIIACPPETSVSGGHCTCIIDHEAYTVQQCSATTKDRTDDGQSTLDKYMTNIPYPRGKCIFLGFQVSLCHLSNVFLTPYNHPSLGVILDRTGSKNIISPWSECVWGGGGKYYYSLLEISMLAG